MPVPTETIWEMQPHTGAKHAILQGYLKAWFPIIFRADFRGLTYFEGFAGPGEYSRAEPGSPIIALRTLLEVSERTGLPRPDQQARFAFIEKDPTRKEYLEALLEDIDWPGNVQVEVRRGLFEDLMEPLLTTMGAWGAPIFANLDTWGADVPFENVQRLAQSPSSEVLVTLLSTAFRKLASREEPMDKIDRMYGSQQWRRVVELPEGQPKIQFLTDEYRNTLRRAGFPFTLAFELEDEGGRGLFLMFGTKSVRGIEEMKKAMWKVDRVYGVRFRDPRDTAQTALNLDQPDLAPLHRHLMERLNDRRRHGVHALRQLALLETVYRPEHAMDVLRTLKKEKRLGQHPPTGPIRKDGQVRLLD